MNGSVEEYCKNTKSDQLNESAEEMEQLLRYMHKNEGLEKMGAEEKKKLHLFWVGL